MEFLKQSDHFFARSSRERPEIFVIDDDEDLCEVMCWALEKEGFRIRTFSGGEVALGALATGAPPQLLIVDFHLGDMDGNEFLRRCCGEARKVPVILVSGSPHEVEGVVPEEAYTTIVEKPLDLERLLREVRRLSAPGWKRSSTGASTHSSHGPASAR